MTEQSTAATPAVAPHSGNGTNPVNKRLSDAMKAAHAKKPNAWTGPHPKRAQILAMIEQGASTWAIARKLHAGKGVIERMRAEHPGPVVPSKREEVAKLVRSGHTNAVIAKKLHVGQNLIGSVRREIGYRRPAITREPGQLDAAAREARNTRIAQLLKSGLKPGEIAERMSIHPSTVYAVNQQLRVGEKPPPAPRNIPRNERERIGAGKRQQVAALTAEGLDREQIASRLGMTVAMVGYYRSSATFPVRGPNPPVETRPFAETIVWLRHAYQEALNGIRAGREPSITDLYAMIAYKKQGK